MKMKALLAAVFLIGLAVFIYRQGMFSLKASVPPNMPPDARFVQTGYDLNTNDPLGNWIVCRRNLAESGDWCRVTSQRGDVVFEGQFLPLDSPQPVPAGKLAIGSVNPHRLWITGPAEQAPVPAIPLADGQLLVPIADRLSLLERWSKNPKESPLSLEASE
jgi:hypothetical protein